MATEPFLVNPRRIGRRRRPSRRNPVGDELVILGGLAGNPRRRAPMATRRRRRRRRATSRRHTGFFLNMPRRRRRRRRTYAYAANPRRRSHRRRRRAFLFNSPRRRHRRRYRHNPAAASARFELMRPMTWVPYVMTGGIAAVATAAAPRFMGPAVTPMWAYGIQGAVAVGGAMALPMLGLRPMHGLVWFVVSGAVIAADLIVRYAMPAMGLAAYPYEQHAQLSSMGQEPYYPPTLSWGSGSYYQPGVAAYPYQWEQMGAYEAVPGAPSAPFEIGYGHAA